MTERKMFKGLCIGFGGVLIAMALAAPVLADSPLAKRAASSLAVPVSGERLSQVRGEILGNQSPDVVLVRTENRDFGDTLPSGDFLSNPRISGEVATASARLEQIQTGVSMIAQ